MNKYIYIYICADKNSKHSANIVLWLAVDWFIPRETPLNSQSFRSWDWKTAESTETTSQMMFLRVITSVSLTLLAVIRAFSWRILVPSEFVDGLAGGFEAQTEHDLCHLKKHTRLLNIWTRPRKNWSHRAYSAWWKGKQLQYLKPSAAPFVV